MRATGYRMVDLLVERVAGLRDEPALTRASPAEMRARMHGPAVEKDVLVSTTTSDEASHDADRRRHDVRGARHK